MRTSDWKYDFATLPRWDNREKFCGVYDEYYEIPQSDTLCCLYSIYEVSMLDYLGFLAILKNKDNPKLVLNITEKMNFCVNFSASEDGNLIFLQPSIYDPVTNRCLRPVLILDIQKSRFAYIKTSNYCTDYQVLQKKPNVFVIEADEHQQKNNRHLAALHGRKIWTRWLRWHKMDKLSALPQMIL